MSNNKLGPHVNRGVSQTYLDAGPAVAVFATSWGQIQNAHPNTLCIGIPPLFDLSYDAQALYKAGLAPLAAVDKFVSDTLPWMNDNPWIEWIYGFNEPVWDTEGEMAWFAQFEVERMHFLDALGKRSVIGSFATGRPNMELWPAFMPALQVARDMGAVLSLHEYGGGTMWWMTGTEQVDPGAGCFTSDGRLAGWTTLRYRQLYDQFLVPEGLGDLLLVITETGIDPLVSPVPPGCPGGAWTDNDLQQWWWDEYGLDDPAGFYHTQLRWYEDRLKEDPVVIGAAVFTFGHWSGQPWKAFDVADTDVEYYLVQDALAHPARPWREYFVVPMPEPSPSPGDGDDDKQRGAPREPYERTYVLLPPALPIEMVLVAMKVARMYSATVGFSADDAGIGDLDVRRVVVVNPKDIGDGLSQEWYDENYPGVEMYAVVADTEVELQERLFTQLRALY